MKCIKKILTSVLWVASLSSQAQQDDDVFNRVNGVKFENKLYLRWNENSKSDATKWECRKDNDCKDCANWHSLEDLDYFNVRNGYSNDYKIVLQFYNPLKYSMKSAATDVVDPTYSAINEFISKLPNVKMDDIPKFDAVKKIDGPEVRFGGKGLEQRKSPIGDALLYDWTARLKLIVGDTAGNNFKGSKEKFATLMKHLSYMKEIEDYLYGEIRIDSLKQTYSLQMWLKQMANDLYKANDYSDFDRAIKRAKFIDSQLSETKKRATENFDKIVEVLSEQYDNYFPFIIDKNLNNGEQQIKKATKFDDIYTFNLAKEFKEVRVIHHEKNLGVGQTMIDGFTQAKKDYVFYTDGDAQYDVRELALLAEHTPQYDLIIGYRIRRAEGFTRAFTSRCFHLLNFILFGINCKDIDCSFKLLHRRFLDKIQFRTKSALVPC